MNKNFTILLIGQSLANIGDILYMVSIINLIFALQAQPPQPLLYHSRLHPACSSQVY